MKPAKALAQPETNSNVVIHGGAGFIGSGIRSKLSAKGISPIVIDTESRIKRLNLCSQPTTNIFVNTWPNHVDTLIYLTWSSYPFNPMKQIGIDASRDILESLSAFTEAIERGASKIIFASSGGTVYGKPNILPANESLILQPMSGYGASKVAVEMYLRIVASSAKICHLSLRLSNPYGPYQFAGTPIGLIARFVTNAIEGIPHVIYGSGNVIRDYLHIDDASEAFAYAAVNNVDSGIYNVGSGYGLSINQIADMVDIEAQTNSKRMYVSERLSDVPAIFLDSNLFIKQTGWHPTIGIQDGIRDMVKQYISHRQHVKQDTTLHQ